jgi:hypothetical protein
LLATGSAQAVGAGEYRDIPMETGWRRRSPTICATSSNDDHLQLRFNYWLTSADSTAKQSEEEARQAVAANCFFDKVEHLPRTSAT